MLRVGSFAINGRANPDFLEIKRLRMTYEKKLTWLEKVFSNNPAIRQRAMGEDIPQPLFENREELKKAINELMASSDKKQGKEEKIDKRISLP